MDCKKHSKLCSQRLQRKTRHVLTAHPLYEGMATINSRPLTYQCLNDRKSLEPLTANHLLTMQNKTFLPLQGNFVKEEVYGRERWRKVQFLAGQFCSWWRKEYLISFNSTQKKFQFQPKRNLKIGDIVIVQEEVPRNEWPLGKVTCRLQQINKILFVL